MNLKLSQIDRDQLRRAYDSLLDAKNLTTQVLREEHYLVRLINVAYDILGQMILKLVAKGDVA